MHRDDSLLADAVVLALLAALGALDREERLALILRRVFGVPEHEIAALLDRGAGGPPRAGDAPSPPRAEA
jgi:DNA-directed RNA polymerase specialized sigma24 family protein